MNTGDTAITTILTEDEIKAVMDRVREEIGEDMFEDLLLSDIDPERITRFMPVADRCQQERSKKNLSLAATARALRARQQDIKAIEETELQDIKAGVLHRYLGLLGLTQWFDEWAAVNQELAATWPVDPKEDSESSAEQPRRRSGTSRRGGRRRTSSSPRTPNPPPPEGDGPVVHSEAPRDSDAVSSTPSSDSVVSKAPEPQRERSGPARRPRPTPGRPRRRSNEAVGEGGSAPSAPVKNVSANEPAPSSPDSPAPTGDASPEKAARPRRPRRGGRSRRPSSSQSPKEES